MSSARSLVDVDPWLEPYRSRIEERRKRLRIALAELDRSGGLLGEVSQGYRYFGLNRAGDRLTYREWAPGARELYLIGDFNDWDRRAHPLKRDTGGVWSLELPASAIAHGSRVKFHVFSEHGEAFDRIPAYIRRTVQEANGDFNGQHWDPSTPFVFENPSPIRKPGAQALRIYEAHIGMSSEEPRVASYAEFSRHVLPRIAALGYDAIQLMAVQEHPFYGSFGYHVSSFFAPSSRFGTPEELKALIDDAHGLGISVLLDLVHSHSVKNVNEGLARIDGSASQYFHPDPRGHHPAWDSKLFDYSKPEVRRFLLSNVRYWLEEFRFDGFRFDGVTSMLYLDHGINRVFTSYDDYFGAGVDEDALLYLQLANAVAHAARPDAITIAEDVSGMPGTARPLAEGGLGFDYRLAMGVPDQWIKLVKERRDEDWNLGSIYHTLLNRRRDEKHVGYSESHDQALVGDKTLAFRLMDAEMYTSMARAKPSPVVDRGIALLKLIRLLSFSLAGEAWLDFMGNEFGHPEWVDFPGPHNGDSFKYARRQWSLADRTDLRYRGLLEFTRAMLELDRRFGLLSSPDIDQLAVHEADRVLVFGRGTLVFAFNFDGVRSHEGYRIPLPEARDYRVVLDTDHDRFEGFGRVSEGVEIPWQKVPMYGRGQSAQVYLPTRTALVLVPTEK